MTKQEKIADLYRELDLAENYPFNRDRHDVAEALVQRDYGNVKQAVKEFAEKLKAELWKFDVSWQEYDGEELCETVDNLITELYGADDQ